MERLSDPQPSLGAHGQRSEESTGVSRAGADGAMRMAMPEVVFASSAPFPILSASAQWCAMFGVREADLKGCGFKAFDSDIHPLSQVCGCTTPGDYLRAA